MRVGILFGILKRTLGTFYKKNMPTFEDRFLSKEAKTFDRELKIKEILENNT
ncbi:MAG: hypothetical protein Q8O30_12200 [Candidatus Omnitrophota bacterium]|nr:hypothetical protein [Candidatus Omnitrophota bacterium]